MGRPRKADTQDQATVKIERAFWHLLETESYKEITVRRISQESGTNRNSFYYHYRDIEDLAYKAFRNNADSELSRSLLRSLLSVQSRDAHHTNMPGALLPAPFDPEIIPYARRIMLCAGSGSPFLTGMVYDLLREMWLSELGIKEELLSDTDNLRIQFIFSGLTAILGSREVRQAPQLMPVLAQTDIGRAAIDTLRKIAASQAAI